MATRVAQAPAPCLVHWAHCARRARAAPPACRAGATAEAHTATLPAAPAAPRRALLLAAGAAMLMPARAARAAPAPETNPEPIGGGLMRFYGRATSSSSYGGYGGSDTNFRYYFELPDSWKSDTVSKVDKATNGTDVRYSDPVTKARAYVTSFNGYPVLKQDRRSLIDDLALSDSSLQDALSYADDVVVAERTTDEQLYVDFDIISGGRTIYATVTSDGARLYALFCIGATPATDEAFRTMRTSLRYIK